ncbi:YsnF/AvaK domain-containing protein, partial [Streptomyces sp. SID5910]|uniref:YsnF/AvaK domain-containing protein n=1 Tax=Streptomyces sp. SID5910 TaxID=2690312 RepID=UPI00136AAEA6
GAAGTAGLADTADTAGTTGREDMAGRRGMRGDDAMTRSEERMHVGIEQHEVGRARLRKYVVTEEVEQTVPVRHEEVRVEREPITDANRDEAMAGQELGEAEHEVTLHEERAVVETETVPVERVRLTTEEHIENETVRGQVRKERIEAETEGITEDDIRRGRE